MQSAAVFLTSFLASDWNSIKHFLRSGGPVKLCVTWVKEYCSIFTTKLWTIWYERAATRLHGPADTETYISLSRVHAPRLHRHSQDMLVLGRAGNREDLNDLPPSACSELDPESCPQCALFSIERNHDLKQGRCKRWIRGKVTQIYL
jgi:hypothetical protein